MHLCFVKGMHLSTVSLACWFLPSAEHPKVRGSGSPEGYIKLETEWKSSEPLLQGKVGDGNVNRHRERTFSLSNAPEVLLLCHIPHRGKSYLK